MDVQAYCSGLEAELTGWKGKVSDVVSKFDRRDTGDKDKVAHEIRNLHMVVEELTDRIERLRSSCPTQWEPDKIELESKITELKTKWEDVWDKVSPSDFGG
jgi:predicted nuclease with TOPRIM domain